MGPLNERPVIFNEPPASPEPQNVNNDESDTETAIIGHEYDNYDDDMDDNDDDDDDDDDPIAVAEVDVDQFNTLLAQKGIENAPVSTNLFNWILEENQLQEIDTLAENEAGRHINMAHANCTRLWVHGYSELNRRSLNMRVTPYNTPATILNQRNRFRGEIEPRIRMEVNGISRCRAVELHLLYHRVLKNLAIEAMQENFIASTHTGCMELPEVNAEFVREMQDSRQVLPLFGPPSVHTISCGTIYMRAYSAKIAINDVLRERYNCTPNELAYIARHVDRQFEPTLRGGRAIIVAMKAEKKEYETFHITPR